MYLRIQTVVIMCSLVKKKNRKFHTTILVPGTLLPFFKTGKLSILSTRNAHYGIMKVRTSGKSKQGYNWLLKFQNSEGYMSQDRSCTVILPSNCCIQKKCVRKKVHKTSLRLKRKDGWMFSQRRIYELEAIHSYAWNNFFTSRLWLFMIWGLTSLLLCRVCLLYTSRCV